MAKFETPKSLAGVPPDKMLLIKGSTILALLAEIKRVTAIAGPGLAEQEGWDGTVFTANRSASTTCVLGLISKPYAGSPAWWVSPGYIFASANSIFIPETLVGVHDAGTQRNKKVWVKTELEADVVGGVLQAGCELTSAVVEIGLDVPSNKSPTWDDPTGWLIVAIGAFSDDDAPVWQPLGCGNVHINHCPGVLSHTRG